MAGSFGFEKGDKVSQGLKEFAKKQVLAGSHFTAIDPFSDAVLGYFDRERREYKEIPVKEQVEVLTLVGVITLGPEAEPKSHAHVVLGKADGSTIGGHILEAHVWPTLELVIVESPKHLQRQYDDETGLALITMQ